MKTALGFCFSLAAASAATAQAPPPVSQTQIDKAIARGVEYLRTAPSPGGHLNTNCDELILLTLIHSGLPDKDEQIQKLLKITLEAELRHTYKVALHAMCLEELDRSTFQWRLAQCAQFLVDNQCANGQWSYGSPTEYTKDIPSGEKEMKPPAPTKGAIREFNAERVKPKITRRLRILKKRSGPESGDNSNSQYASLGMRACHDGGIDLPDESVHMAIRWWMESQHPDEGGAKKNDVASGDGAKTQGWNYTKPGGNEDRKPYLAMTAGALGAVCIYDYIAGRDYKKDPVAKAGASWIAKHFSVNGNYYYMYGLERAGMLYGVETFGTHAWYMEGARFIVSKQAADGSWGEREKKEENTWDTCWAILFLKRATRPIATEGGRGK